MSVNHLRDSSDVSVNHLRNKKLNQYTGLPTCKLYKSGCCEVINQMINICFRCVAFV